MVGLLEAHPAGRLRDRVGRQDGRGWFPVASTRLGLDRHEGGAVAAEAREILVAGRRVDLGLRPELRLDPVERHAVREGPAVPAALADLLVDHDEPVGRRHLPALLPAPTLVGADAVVDQHGDAGRGRELPEHRLLTLDRLDTRVGGELGAPIRVRVLRQDHRRPHALQLEHPRQLGHGLAAHHLLGPRVGDEPVVQDLERHVGAGRDAEPDVQERRVEQRAVADVLHDVRAVRVRLEPDPRETLAAELSHRDDVALGLLDDRGERVAAGAPPGHLARQEEGADVVGAPRAVVRRPPGMHLVRPRADRPDRLETAPDPDRQLGLALGEAEEARAEPLRNQVGVHAALDREQWRAGLVRLAQHRNALPEPGESFLHLPLEEAPLLLDDHDLSEVPRETAHGLGIERIDQPHAQEAHPETL